jgi:peptide/nickel transport system ATP-binding protein/oligopeptide transport system ATP-binding protein
VFISHDLRVVRHIANDIVVMYAGKVVEQGSVVDIYRQPQHAYTRNLLAAIPGKKAA